ncbi:MAG TPA: glycosyltransferase family 39 protein [Edaphobacter sp.]|jgi:4-amino-4-deoxy-L-arabinose transferase-like glycosyltransferase
MVLAALIVRLMVVVYGFRDQTDPSDHHAAFGWEMGWVARSIFEGHGFSSPFFPLTGSTAMVPPLFPYLVAAIFHLFGLYTAKAAFAILSINSLLSALTCIPLYFSARYALGEKAATMAGWGWVIYPYAIYFSGARVWDYALTGLLFTICFCFAQRLHRQERFLAWLGFGLLYGVAALANPSVLTMFPVFLLLAVLEMRRRDARWALRCAVAAVGLLTVLTPWTIHNYRTLHFAGPVRDNFWLECWAGNNGDTFESNAVWAHPASNPLEMQRYEAEGEMGYIAEKKTLALNFIAQNPSFFAGLSLRRAFSYWTAFWSFSPAYLNKEPLEIADVFFCSSVTVLMLLGARRFWLRDSIRALHYLALIAVFPITYYVTHATPDYRQPIEPEVVVLVVMGVLSLKRMMTSAALREETMEDEESQLAMSMSAMGQSLNEEAGF